jgi:catechol 2,3-dioxygenase-like lactoylglutathione lyase family enzyme
MTVRRVVVDHVLLVVRDLEASRRFYRAALAPLGIQELKVESDGVAFGADCMDDFAVFAGRSPTTGAHVAFDAPSREAVDAFYAVALAHGGRHRGAPGVWAQYSERYYAAYVWDPDGNLVGLTRSWWSSPGSHHRRDSAMPRPVGDRRRSTSPRSTPVSLVLRTRS